MGGDSHPHLAQGALTAREDDRGECSGWEKSLSFFLSTGGDPCVYRYATPSEA